MHTHHDVPDDREPTDLERVEAKLDRILDTLDTILGTVKTVSEHVGPTLEALEKSPVLRMLGVTKK